MITVPGLFTLSVVCMTTDAMPSTAGCRRSATAARAPAPPLPGTRWRCAYLDRLH